jgi:SAM-dependent methyltransferase
MCSQKQFYDDLHSLHESGRQYCRNSVTDFKKAKTRCARVLKFFKVALPLYANVLDVGSGLGYYAAALSKNGNRVVGIDISEVAVEASRRRFQGPFYTCGSFPEDVFESFDLIWAVDLSLINTFDKSVIGEFVKSCLQRLNPNGTTIISWHTDFSGEIKDGWANWDSVTISRFCQQTRLHGPAIVQARFDIASHFSMLACHALGKSAPVFMAFKATAGAMP